MSRGLRRNNTNMDDMEEDSRSPEGGEHESERMSMLRVLMEEQRKADRAREEARRQEEGRKEELRREREVEATRR